MELELYLKDQYEDFIFTCQRCSKIVLTVSPFHSIHKILLIIKGIKCENDGCELSR
jgi:hypothetical protein